MISLLFAAPACSDIFLVSVFVFLKSQIFQSFPSVYLSSKHVNPVLLYTQTQLYYTKHWTLIIFLSINFEQRFTQNVQHFLSICLLWERPNWSQDVVFRLCFSGNNPYTITFEMSVSVKFWIIGYLWFKGSKLLYIYLSHLFLLCLYSALKIFGRLSRNLMYECYIT